MTGIADVPVKPVSICATPSAAPEAAIPCLRFQRSQNQKARCQASTNNGLA